MAARRQVAQQGHHLGAALAVERAGGLVGEDDAAAVHQRAGDRHALLLAAGELVGLVLQAIGQAQRGEQFGRARMARLRRHAGVDRGDLDVLLCGGRGDQVVALEHEAEGLAPQLRKLVAVQARHVAPHEAIGAAARAVQAAEDVHQRGLARARGAHDGDELAGVDLQRHVVQHLHRQLAAAVGLGHRLEPDQRLAGRRRGGGRGAHMNAAVIFGRALGGPLAAGRCGTFCWRVPTTTCSPGSSPESTCAETRFMVPTAISRSATLPSAATTRTSARPLAYSARGSPPAAVARSPRSLRAPDSALVTHRRGLGARGLAGFGASGLAGLGARGFAGFAACCLARHRRAFGRTGGGARVAAFTAAPAAAAPPARKAGDRAPAPHPWRWRPRRRPARSSASSAGGWHWARRTVRRTAPRC